MFKFGKAALYERMLREKDRHIDILAEQIDYLRARIAGLEAIPTPMIGTSLKPSPEDIPEVFKERDIEVKPYVSDEELDALAMLESGRITKDELPELLAGLGMTPELEFESVG